MSAPDPEQDDPATPHALGSVPRIVGFRTDEAGEWIARLDCDHERHVRHDPPWHRHPWILTPDGRAGAIGRPLRCGHCERARSGTARP